MRRSLRTLIAIGLFLFIAPAVEAQWQDGNLALLTNGNVFQPGDRLRVEMLSLDRISDLFYTQVSYSYTEPVTTTDDEGKATTSYETRTRTRPPGPTLESLEAHRIILLDDSLTFGEGSPTGIYRVEVAIFSAYSKQRLATLRSCLFFPDAGGKGGKCGLHLRSLKRVNSETLLTFEGDFPAAGRFSVVLLSSGRIVEHIGYGAYVGGPRELVVSADELRGTTGRIFDILLHDHETQQSSTLARVTISSPQ